MSDQLLIVIGLAVAGYILLLLELAVAPGFGVPGILGILSLVAASVSAVFFFGGVIGSTVVVAVVATTSVLLWWVPRTHLGRHLIHRQSLAGARAARSELAIGDRGVAESDLRPSGVARFGACRESVVTEGEFVVAGTPVDIIQVEGGRVVVAPTDDGGV
jgi:membrane-bound serine protease (ClpP class)